MTDSGQDRNRWIAVATLLLVALGYVLLGIVAVVEIDSGITVSHLEDDWYRATGNISEILESLDRCDQRIIRQIGYNPQYVDFSCNSTKDLFPRRGQKINFSRDILVWFAGLVLMIGIVVSTTVSERCIDSA